MGESQKREDAGVRKRYFFCSNPTPTTTTTTTQPTTTTTTTFQQPLQRQLQLHEQLPQRIQQQL